MPTHRANTPLPAWLTDFRKQLGAELVETHISWLLLSERYAYKIKKPVCLPFLDYGSAAKREFFCNEELRLNRRLAGDLYVDVVPVAGTTEWAVRMHRFDESSRLDHVCAANTLTRDHVVQLARTLADFHAQTDVAPHSSDFGSAAAVSRAVKRNFVQLRAVLPDHLVEIDALEQWMDQQLSSLAGAIESRKEMGRVRECHGDLHLANMVLIGGKVVPFDCIEFDESLRWIDVVSEVAFVYMDLVAHQRPDLALWLLDQWLEVTGDFDGVRLLRFYAAYRAQVRAMVAAMSAQWQVAATYLQTALIMQTLPALHLTITFGVSGSGKSTASARRLLADAAAMTIRVHSDIERKRLYGYTALERTGSSLSGGIYTVEAGERTYARLAVIAHELLAAGWSVIVDATFLQRCDRQTFRSIAGVHDAGFSILACSAPQEELQRRITTRTGDASEASVAVLAHQLRTIEPLSDDELSYLDSDSGVQIAVPPAPTFDALSGT